MRNRRIPLGTATARAKVPVDALKIVKALQNFVADNEDLDGLSEPEVAALAQAIKEEVAAESSSRVAMSWNGRLRRYLGLQDSKEGQEFFEQFARFVKREAAKKGRQVVQRSVRSSTNNQPT